MGDINNKTYHIIKRVKKVHNKHHGGQWKIAYADFVTAMMAFFLLMWLLSLLNKYQREGIAEYFKKPVSEIFTAQKLEKDQPPPAGKPPVSTTKQPANTLFKMLQLKKDLEKKMETDPKLKQFKNQLNFIITSDGLKIELKDLEGKPMFSEGQTDFRDYAEDILSWLGPELNSYPNQVMIIGHTDSAPYPGETNYTNWELSADRANATRRALIDYGMEGNKIIRIVGSADKEPLNTRNGLDASNRRIEIIILTDEAVKKIEEE